MYLELDCFGAKYSTQRYFYLLVKNQQFVFSKHQKSILLNSLQWYVLIFRTNPLLKKTPGFLSNFLYIFQFSLL